MKKLVIISILLLTIGCQNNETVEYKLDNNNYKVAVPYKNSISNYTKESYDTETSENMLIEIMSNYLNPNTYFYEEGQYLTTDIIKEILNELDEDTITLYEQNYIKDNEINIVVGVITKNMSDDEMKDTLNKTYTKLNSIFEDKNIITVLFNESNNMLNGSYKYILENDKLQELNYQYQFLDGNYVIEKDMNTYNGFSDIKNNLNELELFINGIGLYKNEILDEILITINKDYLKTSEILYISEIITAKLSNFNNNVYVRVNFFSNSEIKATITKKSNDLIDLHILEG